MPYQMNLYETEALTFDPERRRRGIDSCWCIFFYFCLVLFVLRSRPVWVDKCAWCLFLFFLRREENIRLLCFSHFITLELEEKGEKGDFYFLSWTCGTTAPLRHTLEDDPANRLPDVCVLVSCVGHVPVFSGGRRTSHKQRRRITFQTLMNVENKSLLTWSSVNHVRNQKMLYLYNQWCNKDGELVLAALKGQFTQKWTFSHDLLALLQMEVRWRFRTAWSSWELFKK